MFRSQSKSKSLKLQRETVRVLAGSQLASAQGGGGILIGNIVNPPVVVTRNIDCPSLPDVQPPDNISRNANACGNTFPSISIIVNPLP